MIGRIAGRIDYRAADHVLIDCGGVGYLVYVSKRTLAALPAAGDAAALYTDLVVREDLLQLYGFPTLLEKEWHRLLTSVQGVGAKASLAMLGALGPDGVARAIALGDTAAIRAAPGVGPKLAQRVANELKDKAPLLMAQTVNPPAQASVSPVSPASSSGAGEPKAPTGPSAQAEALSALLNLGYTQADAATAAATAAAEAPEADTAALIRAALRTLAPKG